MFKSSSGHCLFQTVSCGHTIEVRENWRYRWMHFGGLSIQSAMKRRKASDPVLPYLPPLLAGIERFAPAASHLLLLGLGGGSLVRYYAEKNPALKITAIEIDPAVIEIAARFFALPPESDHFNCLVADAEDYIHHPHELVDVVVADIYCNEHLPSSLKDQHFYQGCYNQLAENGLLCVNLVIDDDSDFFETLGGLRDQFANQTLVINIPRYRNCVVFASKSALFTQQVELLAQQRILRGLRNDPLLGYCVDKIR